jgi:hypothetical protein
VRFGLLRKRGMDKQQQEAIGRAIGELIDIKYELSNYVDDELIELGMRFDKAIANLIELTHTADLIDR